MGLDWMLFGRAKPGNEEEFARSTAAINRLQGQGRLSEAQQKRLQQLVQRREHISVSPWEEVGCPMIGRDAAADRWLRRVFRERHSNPDDEWAGRKFAEVLEECRGVYVEELAKDLGGIALIQGPLAGMLNFRGKAVSLAEAIVGPELAEEAYFNHTAEECLHLAARLDQAIGEWLEHCGDASCVDDSHDHAEHDLFALLAAVQWLRFWGSRGFGYEAWD